MKNGKKVPSFVRRSILGLLVFLIFSPYSIAKPAPWASLMGDHYFFNTLWYPVVTLTGGPVLITHAGRSQSFPIVNPISDSFYNYVSDRGDHSEFMFGGFLGAEFLVEPEWNVQLGVGYYQPDEFNVKGVVTQGADLQSADQYHYCYAIRSHQIFAESKVLFNWRPSIHPYLSAGLGAAINDASNYNVTILPPFTAFSPQFPHHTNTAFSYHVGLGIDVNVAPHLRVGAGYRFTDLGETKLGNGVINTVQTSKALSKDHTYAHEGMLQLTYLTN